MRYLIIGLGIYGINLSRDLTDLGNEVIAADSKPSVVESIKDYVSATYIIDSTDETSLGVLPLKNVDRVIVAIGENFGASVKTVALLKKMGVGDLYARAIDPIHESILQGFNISRVIKPEQQAASTLAMELQLGGDVMAMNVDRNNYVMQFTFPSRFEGIPYSKLEFGKKYGGLQLIAATRKIERKGILGIKQPETAAIDIADNDAAVAPGDVAVCYGSVRAFRELAKG